MDFGGIILVKVEIILLQKIDVHSEEENFVGIIRLARVKYAF